MPVDAVAEEDILARIKRSNAETEKFIEESYKLRMEEMKLRSESYKLQNEAFKMQRERAFYPFVAMASALTAGAALFGAGAAFAKLYLH